MDDTETSGVTPFAGSISDVILTLIAVFAMTQQPHSLTIQVDPTQVISRPTAYMTGACIEDVNHEIYGGIYSQMVFGESFAEPPHSQPIDGFTAYGGEWIAKEGVLYASAGSGPKLVLDQEPFSVGTIEVEVYIPNGQSGFGGVLVNVGNPGIGADRFDGYELSIDGTNHRLILGRHRQNWEPIDEYSCDVATGKWIKLRIDIAPGSIKARVNGKLVTDFVEKDHLLGKGTVALRPWQSDVQYKDLTISSNGKMKFFPLKPDQEKKGKNVSGMWDAVQIGSAEGAWDTTDLDTHHSPQSQRIAFQGGTGEIGISNRGLNRRGMGFVANKPYEGILWAKAQTSTELFVSLESQDGTKRYAETKVTIPAGKWTKAKFKLKPKQTETNGRLSLALRKQGEISLGYASLEPGAWGRFKGLPVRKDVAEGLIKQGLTVLRMGGCMVNCTEYRWKNMIGPRDERPVYRGFWYPHSSNGWGVIELIKFCEAAGFLGIPDFFMGESPQDMADFVEYANGASTSEWGKKRVAEGHPSPFNLQYIQLGNEEQLNEDYWAKFKPMAEAIWKKDPSITIVVGDFAYFKEIVDPFDFWGGLGARSLAIQKKIVEFAYQKKGKIAFDLHVSNDDPEQPDTDGGGLPGLRSFIRELKNLCPGMPFKVVVFEENAGNHTLRRGLGHAHMVGELMRIGDDVPIVCAANCLQPDKQNDNDWDQGMLFLSPNSVWGQSSYYVTQMISKNYLPVCVEAKIDGAQDVLDVTATRSNDGKLLQLAVVNLKDYPVNAIIDFPKWSPSKMTYRTEWIAGKLSDENTEQNPTHIVSHSSVQTLRLKEGMLGHSFPAHSFTIIRMGG